jgi:histidine triad (HIT) family protein/ATP adenylyltransferase
MEPREELDLDWYDRVARSACFVCALVAGRPLMPGHRIVYEDDAAIAFLTPIPPQRGYALVCPKRHVERFETDFDAGEWAHLQGVVQVVAGAVGRATGALRMYVASLGSPERNAHVHVHVCPCPTGTPFERQQWEAMNPSDGTFLVLTDEERDELAAAIVAELGGWTYLA